MVKTLNDRNNWKTPLHPMKSRVEVFQFATLSAELVKHPPKTNEYPH
jgi:hypothetical protein